MIQTGTPASPRTGRAQPRPRAPTDCHSTRINLWTLSPTAATRILLVSGGGERTEFRFVDGQNLNLDWPRFRIHLEERYRVGRAFYFIGYVPENHSLYTRLQNAGYTLVFKEVTYRGGRSAAGVADLLKRRVRQRVAVTRAIGARMSGSRQTDGQRGGWPH